MQSFIEEVVSELAKSDNDMANTIFVLPSKRAGTFLKNSIAKTINKTVFAPEIYSIETFVEKVSGLSYASSTEQLFALYNSYLATTKENQKDSFLNFSKWGQTILQDFNEIDRYLVNTSEIFSHLSAIQELNTYMQGEKTQMIKDYVKFWSTLEPLYHHFNSSLYHQNLATQGFVYRKAYENIKSFLIQYKNQKIIFIGFNALNKAEEYIIQEILKTTDTDIYWDLDQYFLDDTVHDASYFIRQHKKNWSYFNNNPLKGISTQYLNKKNIQIIGVPKNISQANYVGNLLSEINLEDTNLLTNTAIVLGDENLLNPIINAIPQDINRINITMGYPISKTPLAGLFSLYFDLWLSKTQNGWFYQYVLNLLSNPYIKQFLDNDKTNNIVLIEAAIKTKNWTYIKSEQLYAVVENRDLLKILFSNEDFTVDTFLKNCLAIITHLKEKYQKTENHLELEYLFRFYTLFNQILQLTEQHDFITDIKSLQSLYKELLSSETLDFQGEPLQGTQIMGMLESRNLDFETVIITSVNEGILPSGKSNNSFIPFDIKINYGLPTYKEKDAVYTYHFYRLLQRAKNVYIIYNTEPNVLEGNEKSRLITQLLTDENKSGDITEITASSKVNSVPNAKQTIIKNEALLKKIEALAISGFSPTSLSNYIRNPMDFYKQNILKINDTNEVEESVAANTFGTIVHDSLEDLYQPFIGKFLDEERLTKLLPQIEAVVKSNFKKTYLEGNISTGKNLIAYKVILRYIENFIQLEINEVAQHQIKIIALEEKMELFLSLPNIKNPIKIKGKLDRIDEVDGMLRIIDYKTGKVEGKNVNVKDWESIIANYNISKAFQLLCYALLYNDKNPIQSIQAGIISFKNLANGVLLFNENNVTEITQETIEAFKKVLFILIEEVFNPEIPFLEKEV